MNKKLHFQYIFFYLHKGGLYDKILVLEGKGLHDEKTRCCIRWIAGIARIC